MQLKQRQKIIGVITLLAFLSFFLPTHFSHAWLGIPDGTDLIEYIFRTMFNIIGNLTAIVAKGLNLAVFVRPGGNILVVETTWKILRDFSNMFFIIALIYMAFATIFDYGKYRFQDMIVRFVIVAILINFSLVIGNLVIDFSQVLSNIFLGSIGNLGDRLGQYLNPSLLLPPADLAIASLISLVFAIVLSLIFLFSMLVALVFAIIRVPFIWGLLIVSPIAWMSHILPGTNKWWNQWWSYFFGWNLFLPVYLFFMYLGLIFLSKRDEIIGAVIRAQTASGTNPANDPLLASLGDSLTFNLVFFYIFAAVVMVGGTWAAKETTSLMGTGFDKGLGWAKGLVKRAPLPYIGNLQAAGAATTARRKQFEQEGFRNPLLNKMYGGADAQARADSKARDFFRVGARDAGSSEFDKEVGAIKNKLTNLDTIELRARMNSGPEKEQLAVRELLKARNQLTNTEQVGMYEMYAKNNERAALNFANSIEYNKLSAPERQAWFNRNTNQEFRKKVASSMAEKGDYNTAAEVVGASTLFASASDRAIFLRKAIKRLDKTEIANIPTTPGFINSREERAAIGEILAEKQALDGTQILNTYRELGPGSEDGEKFLSKIKFESLNRADRNALYVAAQAGTITDVEIQHKLYESIVEKEEFDATKLMGMVNSYRTDDEKKELLKKAQKKDFIAASNVRFGAGLLPTGGAHSVADVIQDQIDKMKVEDLADLPSGAKGWGDPLLRNAVINRMNFVQGHQGPTAPRPTDPTQPVGAGNPMIPGKPGAGMKLKLDLLEAIKGHRGKIADINLLPNLP